MHKLATVVIIYNAFLTQKKHLFSPSAPITLQSPIKRASKPAGRLEVVARFRGYNQGSGGNNPNAIKIHGQANNDRAFVLG